MTHSGDDGGNRFPPGYEHLAETVKAAKERIQHLNAQIEKVRAGKDGPVPRLVPPWEAGRQPRSRDQTIIELEQEVTQVKDNTLRYVEQSTRLDPKQAGAVRDTALEELHGNEYAEMDDQQLTAERSEERNLNQSQDFADVQRSKNLVREDKAPEPSVESGSEPKAGTMQMSAKFNQTMGYSQPAEKTDAPSKSPERGKEQNEPER